MRLVASTLLLAPAIVMFAAPTSLADDVDPAARSAARKLGQEALKLFDSGDYSAALDKLTTANHLVPTPTLGLYAARCLVKMGRLVEASERYLDVSRMQLERGAPAVMRKALIDAVTERDRLLPTIPTMEVVLEGPQGSGVSILVDDQPFLPGLLGEKRPVDPGRHKATVKRGDVEVSQQTDVQLGQAGQLVLKLPPLPAAPPPPVQRTPPMRVAGWIGVGMGAAGAVLAAVAGGIAVSEEQSLSGSSGCTNNVCNASESGTISTYHVVTKLTTVGMVAGLAGLGFGVPVLLVTPRTETVNGNGAPVRSPTVGATLEPWVSLGSVGVHGTF